MDAALTDLHLRCRKVLRGAHWWDPLNGTRFSSTVPGYDTSACRRSWRHRPSRSTARGCRPTMNYFSSRTYLHGAVHIDFISAFYLRYCMENQGRSFRGARLEAARYMFWHPMTKEDKRTLNSWIKSTNLMIRTLRYLRSSRQSVAVGCPVRPRQQ